MKFLIIHNRYYHVSGPETYLINLKKEIKNYGHHADVFSLNYSKNIKSNLSHYYPEPIGDNNQYSFKNQNLSFFEKLKVISSLFFRCDVYFKLNKLLSDNNYDGAIVLQFWGKLSPSIFQVLSNKNIPIVLRISDFGLICGTNTLLKNNKHSEECIDKKFACIKNKCVDNSYFKSLINKLAQIFFQKKYSENIDFIFPCKNTQFLFQKSGFKNNSYVIPTFYSKEYIYKKSFSLNKIIYIGRVDQDKGLDEIISLFPYSKEIIFEIWGRGNNDYIKKLNEIIYNRKIKNIHFKGEIIHSKVHTLFQDSIFSIIPSKWHDNLPNSLIESLSNGVPVIAPNHGCFPEFISHKKNGLLYDNYDDLKNILKEIPYLKDYEKKKFSLNSTMIAKNTFSSKKHIKSLLKIFSIK
tara:strand:+ start:68 stop:1291 length:1224 start_codon:yes stop_codon:yes gene_type:complete